VPDTQRHKEQHGAAANPRQSPVSLLSISASEASTHTGSQEVTGSIPVSSTNLFYNLAGQSIRQNNRKVNIGNSKTVFTIGTHASTTKPRVAEPSSASTLIAVQYHDQSGSGQLRKEGSAISRVLRLVIEPKSLSANAQSVGSVIGFV
jgi:hypothetical protein